LRDRPGILRSAACRSVPATLFLFPVAPEARSPPLNVPHQRVSLSPMNVGD
jgi:hypothetical protein